jgi:hypothetical protein
LNKFFDFNHPFYRPLWIRVLIVVLTGGWGIFEFIGGSPFWGTIFCGTSALAFHNLFIAFDPREPEAPANKAKGDEPK